MRDEVYDLHLNLCPLMHLEFFFSPYPRPHQQVFYKHNPKSILFELCGVVRRIVYMLQYYLDTA